MGRSKVLWCLIFISIVNFVTSFEVKVPGPKCRVDDFKCGGEIAKYILKLLAVGVKELNVNAIDPLHHDLIEEQVSEFKYALKDSTVIGFKDVKLNFLTVVKGNSMHFDFTIPYYEMRGQFKISGNLLHLPVNQEGTYYLNSTNLHVTVTVDIKKHFVEKDGNTYLELVNPTSSTEILGSVYLHFQSETTPLPADLQKLVADNPKEVAQICQGKIASENWNKIFDEFNKLLAVMPHADYIEEDIH